MSQTALSRIWRAFDLRPHRMEAFKLTTDPAFVDKVHDVVGLYLNPPDRALWCCASTRSHSFRRCGTSDLFVAVDMKAGTVTGRYRHRSPGLHLHFTLTRASLRNLLAVASLEIGSMASWPWMAQLGRLLVRPADPAAAPWRRVHQHSCVGGGDPTLHQGREPGPKAIRLDQEHRCRSHQRRSLLPVDLQPGPLTEPCQAVR